MTCRWSEGEILPAIVTDVTERQDGTQDVALEVASDDGGRAVPFSRTLNDSVPRLAVGDLCAFLIREYDSALGSRLALGLVVAKLDPAYDTERSEWIIASD